MPDELVAAEPPNKKVIPTKSQTYQSTYANNVGLAISFQDWSFTFGEILGADEEGIHLEQKFRVVMSPQQAKLFVVVLSQHLSEYEHQFGEVKLPSPVAKAEEVSGAQVDSNMKSPAT